MVTYSIGVYGVVLISWQHQDIALKTKAGEPGISQEILTQTRTAEALNVPASWPTSSDSARADDLVFVFDRPSGSGPITSFTMLPQQLLAGDLP